LKISHLKWQKMEENENLLKFLAKFEVLQNNNFQRKK
jgi:hypothetical protein